MVKFSKLMKYNIIFWIILNFFKLGAAAARNKKFSFCREEKVQNGPVVAMDFVNTNRLLFVNSMTQSKCLMLLELDTGYLRSKKIDTFGQVCDLKVLRKESGPNFATLEASFNRGRKETRVRFYGGLYRSDNIIELEKEVSIPENASDLNGYLGYNEGEDLLYCTFKGFANLYVISIRAFTIWKIYSLLGPGSCIKMCVATVNRAGIVCIMHELKAYYGKSGLPLEIEEHFNRTNPSTMSEYRVKKYNVNTEERKRTVITAYAFMVKTLQYFANLPPTGLKYNQVLWDTSYNRLLIEASDGNGPHKIITAEYIPGHLELSITGEVKFENLNDPFQIVCWTFFEGKLALFESSQQKLLIFEIK